jgi:hypothetical protein
VAGLIVAALAGSGGILWQLRRVAEAAARLRERVYASDMNLASVALGARNFGHAADLVERHFPTPGQDCGDCGVGPGELVDRLVVSLPAMGARAA